MFCSIARIFTEPQDHKLRRGEGPGRDQRAHAAEERRAAVAGRRGAGQCEGQFTEPRAHQRALVSNTGAGNSRRRSTGDTAGTRAL